MFDAAEVADQIADGLHHLGPAASVIGLGS
jgi:hypothetical protein